MLLLLFVACGSESDKSPDYSCSIEPVAVLALDDSDPLGFSPLEVLDALDSLDGTLTWEFETETEHEYRNVSEQADWTLTLFGGTVVDHVRFVDIDPGGCASHMEGAYAGDAMRFQSVLVDIRSVDSSNHIGGLVDIFVMDDATWSTAGFVRNENMVVLHAASDDLAESLDYSARRSLISDDDWRARPWLHGPFSDLAIGIDMVGSIEDMTGTALIGGADADFDLGLNPTDSLIP